MNLRSEDPFWSKNVDISKTRTWTFSSEMLNEQRIFKKRSALMSFEKSSWKKNIFFEKTEIYGENGEFFLESWDFFLENWLVLELIESFRLLRNSWYKFTPRIWQRTKIFNKPLTYFWRCSRKETSLLPPDLYVTQEYENNLIKSSGLGRDIFS